MINSSTVARVGVTGRGVLSGFSFDTLRAIIHVWAERSRGRADLSRLTDAELADIGLTRFDALQEARKPFWRP